MLLITIIIFYCQDTPLAYPIHKKWLTSTGAYSPWSFNSCISTQSSILRVSSAQRSANERALASCCCSTSQFPRPRLKPAERWPHTSMDRAPSVEQYRSYMFNTHFRQRSRQQLFFSFHQHYLLFRNIIVEIIGKVTKGLLKRLIHLYYCSTILYYYVFKIVLSL